MGHTETKSESSATIEITETPVTDQSENGTPAAAEQTPTTPTQTSENEGIVTKTLHAAIAELKIAHPDIAAMCQTVDDYRSLKSALREMRRTERTVNSFKQALGIGKDSDDSSANTDKSDFLAELKKAFTTPPPHRVWGANDPILSAAISSDHHLRGGNR